MGVVELYNGDCLEIMRGMPDASIDAVITDPPYNVDFTYSGYDDKRPDYQDWCSMWLSELVRVCNGPVAISCGHPNVGMWYQIAKPTWLLCWWKPAAMGRSPVGFCNWDPVVLYGKPHRRNSVDVIRAPIKVLKDTGEHPCPKPIEWAGGLLDALTKPSMTVLDPFMGSGTTGVACVGRGRQFIGIEENLGYFQTARERIDNAYAIARQADFAGRV
jgi:site-specific DNA-methyltransferase (adenine-specific)